MSMFCFQCQEAAKGTGCTSIGVCGKLDDTAAYHDVLVHVLKGLSVVASEAESNTSIFIRWINQSDFADEFYLYKE